MTRNDAGGWLAEARRRLSALSGRPHSEALALLESVLEQPRAWLAAHPELELSPAQTARLDRLLARLLSGEPLPYLLGKWEFYGLELEVSPAVLIPRPETELLVETALAWLSAHPGRRAADAGTGSGCIAASLAVHCPDLTVAAVDSSFEALRVAGRNFARYRLCERVWACQSDLLAAFAGPFDLVCANLPYIPTATLDGLAVARFEPRLALDGGPRGLDKIARLLADAPRWLAPGGLLLLEIESGQGQSAPRLAHDLLPGARVELIKDLAGKPRLVKIEVQE